jgi:hypothetical protein
MLFPHLLLDLPYNGVLKCFLAKIIYEIVFLLSKLHELEFTSHTILHNTRKSQRPWLRNIPNFPFHLPYNLIFSWPFFSDDPRYTRMYGRRHMRGAKMLEKSFISKHDSPPRHGVVFDMFVKSYIFSLVHNLRRVVNN